MALSNVAVAAKDGAATPVAIPGGIRQHDTSGSGAGPNVPEVIVVDSTGAEVLGTAADAAVTNPATSGSLVALTKGVLTKVALMVFGAGTAAAAQRTTLASDDPAVAALGATSGAKVITDANGTLQQYLRGLVSQWVAGTLTFASRAYMASASFTCGTTAYAVRDAVGASGASAILTLANMGPSGAKIMLTSCRFEIDRSALITGEANYTFHLYNASPTAINDSAAWDLVSDDRTKYLGSISIPVPVDQGSTLYVEVNSINKVIKLSGTDLFLIPVTEAAYTPTAAVYNIEMHSIEV